MVQSAAQRLFSQFLCGLNPDVVRLPPSRYFIVLLGGHYEMAPFHGDVPM